MALNSPSLKAVAEVSWSYTISFRNQTTDVVDEVAVFFQKKTGGIDFRNQGTIAPGERRVLDLGLCGDVESYSMGIYIGTTEIFRIPETGNMTPLMASQANPTDQFLCEDSWRLVEEP